MTPAAAASSPTTTTAALPNESDEVETLRTQLERLGRELVAAQQERSQSAAYGLELLNEKDSLQQRYESIEAQYEQAKREVQELREAWNKAVNEQRVSATSVFEKEVQMLNDSDALAASFTHAKQEIERELKLLKLQLDTTTTDKERFQLERDELIKKVTSLEHERKQLKTELRDLKSRETKLFNENSELEEENVSLQKQVSNLRSSQVEFESSKHEIQRLQDKVAALQSQLEEVVTLKRITERQMQEALDALESEREQKYALRKELDKRNSADTTHWTSLAALKGSPHMANLALRSLGSSHRSPVTRELDDGDSPNGYSEQDGAATTFSDIDPSFDIMHDLEMPSIEGSLFDEVHLTEIKKLQQNLEEIENQRSNLNTKLIDVQHKLTTKARQAEEIESKLSTVCVLIEDTYNESGLQKSGATNEPSSEQQVATSDKHNSSTQDVTSTTGRNERPNVIDDFENIHSHLQTLLASYKAYQKLSLSPKTIVSSQASKDSESDVVANDDEKRMDLNDSVMDSDDVQCLRAALFKKSEQLNQMRRVLKSNSETSRVALDNLKSKYEIDKAVVAETMSKLKQEHQRLSQDAATFASLRSSFSARIEQYNSELEKVQSKLAASEQEKNTLNSILRMAIEQKVMLTQKLEALEMDREDTHIAGAGANGGNGTPSKSANGAGRLGLINRTRGGNSPAVNRGSPRTIRSARPGANDRR